MNRIITVLFLFFALKLTAANVSYQSLNNNQFFGDPTNGVVAVKFGNLQTNTLTVVSNQFIVSGGGNLLSPAGTLVSVSIYSNGLQQVAKIAYGHTRGIMAPIINDDVAGWAFYGLDDDSGAPPWVSPPAIFVMSGYGDFFALGSGNLDQGTIQLGDGNAGGSASFYVGGLTVNGNSVFSNNVSVLGTLSGNGSGVTSLTAANLIGLVPFLSLPTNNINTNNASTITSGTLANARLSGAVVLTNSNAGINLSGTFNGNGNSLTNLFNNTITKTNFALATDFTNTTTGSITVFVQARCNPSTTLNALFALLIDPTGSGTYSITNKAGAEADTIFTTVPHLWHQVSGIVPSGGKYRVIDVTSDAAFTITNSYWQRLN